MEMKKSNKILLIVFCSVFAFAFLLCSLFYSFRPSKTASALSVTSPVVSYDKTTGLLTWTADPIAERYRVYYEFSGLLYTTETSYRPTQTGTYSVSSNRGSEVAMSNLVTVDYIPSLTLQAPVLSFDDENTISWTYPDGTDNVDHVIIYLPDGTTVSYSPSISTYLCRVDGDYRVSLIATASSGYSDSAYSNTVSVVIHHPAVTLASPSISYSADDKLISWSAVPHATSYEVRRDSDGVVYPVSSTSFTPPSSDYYSARAVGDGQFYLTSDWGNVIMVELPADPITLATPVVSYNSTTHVLSWTNVNPAVSYEVKETTSGSVVSLTSLAYTVTVSGHYCVRAIGDGVNSLSSPWSSPISIEIPVEPDPPVEPVDKLLPPVLSYDATSNTLSWTTPNDFTYVQFVAVVRPGGVVSLYSPKINAINPTISGDFKVYFVAKDDSGYADSDFSNSVLVQIVDNSFNPFDTIFHAADEFLSIRLFGNEFTLGGVLGIGFGIVLLGVLVKLLMG